jgi:hypothetical protein
LMLHDRADYATYTTREVRASVAVEQGQPVFLTNLYDYIESHIYTG